MHNESYEGESSLGLIMRADGSSENVGQRFSVALVKEQCYEIYFALLHDHVSAGCNKPLS